MKVPARSCLSLIRPAAAELRIFFAANSPGFSNLPGFSNAPDRLIYFPCLSLLVIFQCRSLFLLTMPLVELVFPFLCHLPSTLLIILLTELTL